VNHLALDHQRVSVCYSPEAEIILLDHGTVALACCSRSGFKAMRNDGHLINIICDKNMTTHSGFNFQVCVFVNFAMRPPIFPQSPSPKNSGGKCWKIHSGAVQRSEGTRSRPMGCFFSLGNVGVAMDLLQWLVIF
jgi:hypothetical protein